MNLDSVFQRVTWLMCSIINSAICVECFLYMSGKISGGQKTQRFQLPWSLHSWEVLLVPKLEAYRKNKF